MTKSEQARADALADAERFGLRAAAIMRCASDPWMAPKDLTAWKDVSEWARMAAHAAFRAVPGLR